MKRKTLTGVANVQQSLLCYPSLLLLHPVQKGWLRSNAFRSGPRAAPAERSEDAWQGVVGGMARGKRRARTRTYAHASVVPCHVRMNRYSISWSLPHAKARRARARERERQWMAEYARARFWVPVRPASAAGGQLESGRARVQGTRAPGRPRVTS